MTRRLITFIFALMVLMAAASAVCAVGIDNLLDDAQGQPFKTWKGFKLKSSRQKNGEIRFAFSGLGDARVDVVLVPRDDKTDCFGRSRSFNVFSQTISGEANPDATARLMNEILKRLELNDKGQVLPGRKSILDENRLLTEHLKVKEKKDFIYYYLLVLCTILILTALAFLPRLALIVRDSFKNLSLWEKRLVCSALALALILRVFAPYRLVQLYSGYALTSDAVWFNHVPRYGAGWYVFFNHVFHLLPPDHLSIIWVNVVFSSLSVALLAFLAHRLFNYTGVAASVAFMAALHPLFVKDAVSESMFPLTMFWFLGGLSFISVWIEKRHIVDLIAGMLLFALAMLSRPLLVIFPAVALLFLLPQAGLIPALKQGWKRLIIASVAVYAVAIPNFMHLANVTGDNAFPYAPRLLDNISNDYLRFFSSFNLLWNPNYTPLYMWPLLLAGLWLLLYRERRYGALVPLAASIMLFTIYLVDQPPPSMPRLQIPAQMMLLPLMAAGLALLLQLAHSSGIKARTVKAIAVVTILVATATLIPPYAHLWRFNNSDEEEIFLGEINRHLPDGPFILVRRDMGDKPHDYIDCAFPDYRIVPPQRRGITMGIEEFWGLYSSGALTADKMPADVYFYAGTRCYAQHRDHESEYVRWRMHPDCEEMFQHMVLENVIEKDVQNHPETYHRYHNDNNLRLGLYRIKL